MEFKSELITVNTSAGKLSLYNISVLPGGFMFVFFIGVINFITFQCI